MFYSRGENKRKRWYRVLSIGQKKLLAIGVVLLFAMIAVLTVFIVYTYRAMQYDLERVVKGSGVSTLYACDRQTAIATLSDDEINPVRWDDLPAHLIHAFVAREDENFFEHGGVVYTSVIRSLVRNIAAMSIEQGASTITMQLARNVYEMNARTFDRKLLETVLAQRIERQFDKKTILTQYLNRIYFGQNCYGVAAAASRYFGKHVSELNLVECATIAGLVRAPSLCNPVTDMDNAMGVKRETLARMLELEYITQEEHDRAVAASIRLANPADRLPPVASYASMWAQKELDELREELGENAGGIGVVTNLDMALQQRMEQSMEKALVAVEKPGSFPDDWLPLLNENEQEAQRLKKFYDGIQRPAGMKVRGQDNDLAGVLQCCAMVVDARRNNKGRVLAMVSGRSAVDGRDRWQEMCLPGNAVLPLLYTCACLPGSDNAPIVTGKPDVNGLRLGYDVVSSYYKSLNIAQKLPSRKNELDLYRGRFDMRRVDLARVLFDIQNQGKNYKFRLIDFIWSRGQQLLYQYEPNNVTEYIRRESATTVAKLEPFELVNDKIVILQETLPEKQGVFCMVFNDRGVAVFVWMGFDNPADMPEGKRMEGLIKRSAICLARELHQEGRACLNARDNNEKPKS